MSKISISKETALPATLVPNTIYLVSVGAGHVEAYVSSVDGSTARRMLNEADIQALIDASVSGLSGIKIVSDIAARDALSLTANALILVEDASSDSTVDAGAALYTFKESDSSFTKVSEFESLDVVLDWSGIQNRPASTVAQIDASVANSHTHANKTELDALSQDADGDLNYNGSKVANQYISTAW